MGITALNKEKGIFIALVVVALFFIPSFLFGVAPVWGFIFAVTLALYFHQSIQDINDKLLLLDSKHFKIMLGLYALLVLKMAVIFSIPLILLVSTDQKDFSYHMPWNDFWFTVFPFKYLVTDMALDELPRSYRILINAVAPIFAAGVINIFLSYIRMLNMIALTSGQKIKHYKEVTSQFDPDPARHTYHLLWRTAGAFLGLCFLLLAYEMFRVPYNMQISISEYVCFVTALKVIFLIYTAVFLIFTSIYSFNK